MKKSRFIRAIVAVAVAGCMCAPPVHATSISDLKQQKEEKESRKAEAQAVLSQLQKEQKGILEAIKALDEQVTEYSNQIVELETKQTQLEDDIEVKKVELADAQAEEEKQYEAMKLRIKYSYENGNVSYMDTLFSSSDLSDVVNKSEYVDKIYSYDANMLDGLVEIKEVVAEKKASLESDLAEVESIKLEVEDNKAAVEVMIEGKQIQVDNYNDSIDDYESQVAQLQADIAATDQAIAAAEEAFRQQMAAQAGSTTSAPSNVVINYTGGKLQWPVSTGGSISSYYGPRSMFGRSFHYGLDISCPTGTPIVASETGTVIAAGYSSSMGNYVTIAHTENMTTTYMHNSSLCVSAGQSVSRGEVIALAGSTGQSTGPHCHIAVRINGSYVDPLPYLQ